MYVCLFICFAVCLYASLSVCMHNSLDVYLSACLFVCLSACLPDCLSLFPSFCPPPVCMSVYLLVCLLSVYLSVCLYASFVGFLCHCLLSGASRADHVPSSYRCGSAITRLGRMSRCAQARTYRTGHGSTKRTNVGETCLTYRKAQDQKM